eukprot:30980-Pelagococcus_subviridis.AAC.19
MMLNFDSVFPSRTHRYWRFPRYSTCAERNASKADSARPGPGAASASASARASSSSSSRGGDGADAFASASASGSTTAGATSIGGGRGDVSGEDENDPACAESGVADRTTAAEMFAGVFKGDSATCSGFAFAVNAASTPSMDACAASTAPAAASTSAFMTSQSFGGDASAAAASAAAAASRSARPGDSGRAGSEISCASAGVSVSSALALARSAATAAAFWKSLTRRFALNASSAASRSAASFASASAAAISASCAASTAAIASSAAFLRASSSFASSFFGSATTTPSRPASSRMSDIVSNQSLQFCESGCASPRAFSRISNAALNRMCASSKSPTSTSSAPRLLIRVASCGCSGPSVFFPISIACS